MTSTPPDAAAEPTAWRGFITMLNRDSLLTYRARGPALQPLAFFVIVVSLFPLGVGADAALLHRIAPGIVWVSGLLAALLSLPRLFDEDHADGSLDQWLLSPYPLVSLVAGKIAAHWLTTGLPLTLLAPLLGLQFGLSGNGLAVLTASLALGTPVLSMIGALGAALSLGARSRSVLTALLILPLYTPVLIFGAGAVEAWNAGVDYSGHLALLGAGTLLGALLTPLAVAAALKIAVE